MSSAVSAHRISRRAALRIASGALGLGGLSCAADLGKGFTFIAVNDLHFFDEKCEVAEATIPARCGRLLFRWSGEK